MRGGRDFIFENNELMDCILHKTILKRLGSYIESPEWLKTKGATINPKNEKDNKCFQYALTIALNYNEIKKKRYRFSITPKSLKKSGKTTSQLLLMSYFHHKILKK